MPKDTQLLNSETSKKKKCRSRRMAEIISIERKLNSRKLSEGA